MFEDGAPPSPGAIYPGARGTVWSVVGLGLPDKAARAPLYVGTRGRATALAAAPTDNARRASLKTSAIHAETQDMASEAPRLRDIESSDALRVQWWLSWWFSAIVIFAVMGAVVLAVFFIAQALAS